MKIYRKLLRIRVILIILFSLASQIIFGQLIDFCGALPFHQATSYNPDSIYWDRFGNSYDLYDQLGNSTLSLSEEIDCLQAGYFRIHFVGFFAEDLRNVFCEVFSDLSDLISRPINIDGCGDTVQTDLIYIEVRKRNDLGSALMAATSNFIYGNYNCDAVIVYSNFEKAFFGSQNIHNSSIISGRIGVNQFVNNWYTGIGSISGKYDAYSIILHEALHLMGIGSIYGYWEGGYITKWDSYIHSTPFFNPSDTSTNIVPLFTSDCILNCWNIDSLSFSDSTTFVNAIINNCNTSGNIDFVFGTDALAPISGGQGEQPENEKEFRNYMSHLNLTCNGQNESYVMASSIDTGIIRNEITLAEKNILCRLGYHLDSCEACFILIHPDDIGNAKEVNTCCELFFQACVNDTVEISFDELLCNDFSSGEITITNFRTLPSPPIDTFILNAESIKFIPTAQGRYKFEYTALSCDCQVMTSDFEVYVGPCLNCNEISPCDNLICTFGFEEFEAINSNASVPYELTGTYWGHLLGDNSVDICETDSNKFLEVASFLINREGMSFRLSESIDTGCTLDISFKGSAQFSNTFSWYVSEHPPCSWSDTLVGLGNSINKCESHYYHPAFLYNVEIDSIAKDISGFCAGNPNFGEYHFSIKNGYNFPINYILIEPQESNGYNFLDDIVITKTCIDACFNFSSSSDCSEISYTSCEQDSSYFHFWDFGDDSTSTVINPIHTYEFADTFEVTHILLDSCGHTDTSILNVVVSSQVGECCPDTTIVSSSTWDSFNLPHEGRFHTITVEQGVAFTINDDVELQFCEGGALIIEAGAYVDLEGDLTSYGDMTWKGVYVSGDSALNQAIDIHSGGFNGLQQGFLQTRPGASIKNAEIAVRNYGKEGSSSSGGMIRCQETLFQNNAIGADFIEYQNFNDSTIQPLPSLCSFTGCRFYTDAEYYLNDPFYAFARISKVDGADFKACKFVNTLLPELPSQVKDFGFGIMAKDATFKVHPIMTTGGIGPCPPPCTLIDSTLFHGLGHGIYIMTESQSRPYSVYHAVFENCLRGLTDLTRGGATVLYNTFSLGEVPDQEFSYGQIGAEFHFAHDGFTLQENLFVVKDEETEVIPIGVLCNGLGEFDNEIRRNTFIGVETANQAFGINRDNNLFLPRGLRYFCNEFEETPSYGYDFHIPETSDEDLIHPFQTPGSISGSNISAGNHFAYSAQDFMNYGEGGINYWFYPPGNNEEPRDSFSLNISDFEGLENDCITDYCAPPCIEDIEDIKEDFIYHINNYEEALDNYIDALVSENPLKIDTARSIALYYRRLSSRDAYTVIQHLMIDTFEYNTDSLIRWMGYLDTYSSEVIIAGEYASLGDFEFALDVLETIAIRRDLTPAQSIDLEYLLDIYYLLEGKPLESFSSSDRSFLRSIAHLNTGIASGVARALLFSFGEYIPLPYYQGEQINFRSSSQGTSQTFFSGINQNALKVYPNPTNGDVMIEWDEKEFNCTSLFAYNLFGVRVLEIKDEPNSPYLLDTNPFTNGMYWIIARDSQGKTISGKFIVQRN